MAKPSAPSMPTERQVKEAFKVVSALCPGARIKHIGPEGITYLYPDEIGGDRSGLQPFSGDV